MTQSQIDQTMSETSTLPAHESGKKKKRSRVWGYVFAGVAGVVGFNVVAGGIVFATAALTPARKLAKDYIVNQPAVVAALGAPIREEGWNVNLKADKTVVRYDLAGSARSAKAVVVCRKQHGDWQVDQAAIAYDGHEYDVSPGRAATASAP